MWQYNELYHHGILGQKWGVRRYQNSDGSLTEAGRQRYRVYSKRTKGLKQYYKKNLRPFASDIRRETSKEVIDEFQNDNMQNAFVKYVNSDGFPTEAGKEMFCQSRSADRDSTGRLTAGAQEKYIDADLRDLKTISNANDGVFYASTAFNGRLGKQIQADRKTIKAEYNKAFLQAAIDYGVTNERSAALHEKMAELQYPEIKARLQTLPKKTKAYYSGSKEQTLLAGSELGIFGKYGDEEGLRNAAAKSLGISEKVAALYAWPFNSFVASYGYNKGL